MKTLTDVTNELVKWGDFLEKDSIRNQLGFPLLAISGTTDLRYFSEVCRLSRLVPRHPLTVVTRLLSFL